ncbi:hypothetical protein [Rhodanobacter soli]|uniref:hypothetical protein n=1 Tax=Rhodanobacter soli TaxID=590609 RepID=UPI0031D0392D
MNTRNRVALILVLLALCALASPLLARSAKVKPMQVQADTKAKFDAVAAEVRAQLAPGGRFEFVTKEEQAKLDTNLDAMGALFDKYGTVAQMDRDTKIALFNGQEVVNGILKQRDAERLICRSEMPTGSHIPTTKCRTYGDIQRAEIDSHNYMERFQQRAQPNGSALVPGTLGH